MSVTPHSHPARLSLLAGDAVDRPIARRGGKIVSGAGLIADAWALADRLPERRHQINLCTDRYRFAVGFVAAMLRGQPTLLPPNDAPGALAAIIDRHPDGYILADDGGSTPEVRYQKFDFPALGEVGAATGVPDFAANQMALVLFTSGSTGEPQPQPRSWGAAVSSADAAGLAMGIGSGATILGTVPHQHSYGFESIIMLSLRHGLAFDCARPLLPANIVTALQRQSAPPTLVTTPIHLRALLALTEEMPVLERIICATAPLDAAVAVEAERRFQAPLYEIYGCTEVGQIAVRRTTSEVEWRCLDPIRLERQGDDVVADGPAAANRAILNDVIELRPGNRFVLIGRKADMVNIGGKRSSIAFLNQKLNAIEGVEDGVFVIPEIGGAVTRLTAFVVAPRRSAADILEALRGEIDPAFLPRPLRVVQTLPRNALGKLTRQEIERLFGERA